MGQAPERAAKLLAAMWPSALGGRLHHVGASREHPAISSHLSPSCMALSSPCTMAVGTHLLHTCWVGWVFGLEGIQEVATA